MLHLVRVAAFASGSKAVGLILLNPAYVASVTPVECDYPRPVYRVAMAHGEVWTVTGDALTDLNAWLAVLAEGAA